MMYSFAPKFCVLEYNVILVGVSVICSISLRVKNYFQFSLQVIERRYHSRESNQVGTVFKPFAISIPYSTKSISVHLIATKILLYEYCIAQFVFPFCPQCFGFPDRKRYHQYQKTLHAD